MTCSRRPLILTVTVLLALAAVGARPARAGEGKAPSADFVRDVQPILVKTCYQCHGPVTTKGKLRLDQRDSTIKRDEPVIVPGHAADSPLFQRVSGADPDEVMPPKGKGERLSGTQLATIKRWIDQGAT